MDDYYDSVLRQKVPAGPVVVPATVNVGTGPAPEVPDVAGDLRCRLGIDVPAGGGVAVEVSFAGGGDCLRQPATRTEEPTAELQSLMRISDAVFCLKKKKKKHVQN